MLQGRIDAAIQDAPKCSKLTLRFDNMTTFKEAIDLIKQEKAMFLQRKGPGPLPVFREIIERARLVHKAITLNKEDWPAVIFTKGAHPVESHQLLLILLNLAQEASRELSCGFMITPCWKIMEEIASTPGFELSAKLKEVMKLKLSKLSAHMQPKLYFKFGL